MEIYKMEVPVGPEGLSTGDLFRVLQDAAGQQSTQYGQGELALKAKGLMWVVIRYQIQVERWPRAGECLRLETWPGTVRHGMMPRYYRLYDASEQLCVSGCGIWAVVDRSSRKMVNPDEHGVTLEALVTGLEQPLPRPLRRQDTTESGTFTVPPEYLDSNGHMNNTRYFDLAEQCIGRSAGSHGLVQVNTEHLSEALCGETLQLHWSREGEKYYISGETGDTAIFRMLLQYGE